VAGVVTGVVVVAAVVTGVVVVDAVLAGVVVVGSVVTGVAVVSAISANISSMFFLCFDSVHNLRISAYFCRPIEIKICFLGKSGGYC